MSVGPYLNFAGNCREALDFWKQAFRAPEPRVMTYSEAPANPEWPLPPEFKNRVMHAELDLYGSVVRCSDLAPGTSMTPGDNISLIVQLKDGTELRRIWEALKVGGRISMDAGPQPWSPFYGMVYDKFGVGWQVNQET